MYLSLKILTHKTDHCWLVTVCVISDIKYVKIFVIVMYILIDRLFKFGAKELSIHLFSYFVQLRNTKQWITKRGAPFGDQVLPYLISVDPAYASGLTGPVI